MTILDALRQEFSQVRVSCGDRWLVVNDDGKFVVYSHPYGAKKTRTLLTTINEDAAVACLLGKESEVSHAG